MPEPDKATVLRRAKELAEQDGNHWEPEMRARVPGRYEKIELRHYLDDEGRERYLQRALDELNKAS